MSAAVVEVKDDETFAYYTAYIKDYQQGQLLVHYQDGWRDAEWVAPSKVRPSVPLPDYSTFRPREGDDVEVQAKSQETEPFSWWRAKVKTVKGEFYLINYSDWDDNYNEICSVNQLRPPNPNVHLNSIELVRKEIKMPAEVWADDFATPEEKAMYEHKAQMQYSELQRDSRLYSLIEDPEKHVLILVGPKKSVERASMVLDLHFKHSAELRRMQKRNRQLDQALQESQRKVSEGVMEQFVVRPELVGLVIGKKGKNVKEVEKMEGVVSVKVHPTNGTITILAKTREIALAARHKLEYVEDTFPVPRDCVGRMIGPKFQDIRDIEQKSGCQRINVPDRNQPSNRGSWADGDDELVLFNLTGIRETVEAAKLLLALQLKHVQAISAGIQEEKEKRDQLLSFSNDYGIPVGSLPIRGGAGRGRGRGRGAGGDGAGRGSRGGRGGRGRGRGRGRDASDDAYGDDDEKHADEEDAPPAAAAAAASPAPGKGKKKNKKSADADADANGDAAPADDNKDVAVAVEPQPQRQAGKNRRNKGRGGAAAAAAPAANGDAAADVEDAVANGGDA